MPDELPDHARPAAELRARHQLLTQQPQVTLGGQADGCQTLIPTRVLLDLVGDPTAAGLDRRIATIVPAMHQLAAVEGYNRAVLSRGQRRQHLLAHADYERGGPLPTMLLPRRGRDGGEDWSEIADQPTNDRQRDLEAILDFQVRR